MRRTLLLPLALAAALPTLPAAATATEAHRRLDEIVAPLCEPDEPGLVIAVFDRSEEVFRAERGLADLQTRAPLTASTPIYIASLAKTMTSAAVLSLVGEGRLSLDDPISAHLDGLPGFADDITIRHLLNHTSGLPDYGDLLPEESLDGRTNAGVLDALRAAEGPDFAPGEGWAYCNAAYVLLAHAVERIEGVPLPRVLQRRFFIPLGMRSTWMDAGQGGMHALVARAYSETERGWTPSGRTNSIYGPGGVYSTLDDLVTWTRAFIDGRILNADLMPLATTPATAAGKRTPYSCGWQPEDIGGRGPMAKKEYVASFGTMGGYQCEIVWFPEDDLWYVALSNAGIFIGPPEIAAAVIESR